MKHSKLLVLALLVVLLACLAVAANADVYHEHSKSFWVQMATKEATCVTDGYITWRCDKEGCGAQFEEIIPSRGGHTPGPWVVAEKSTKDCQGDLMVQKCQYCDHIFTEGQYRTAAKSNHEFKPANGATVYSAGKPATCTEPGIKTVYLCAYGCGTKSGNPDVIPALGHSYAEATWKEISAPTCGSEGVARLYCDRNCGNYQQKVTPKTTYHTDEDGNYVANPYTVNYLPAKPATCTEPGCKALNKCPTCGAVDPLNDGSATKVLGHNMKIDKNPDMTYVATCTKDGQTVLYCDRKIEWGGNVVPCGHVQVIVAPKLGHSASWVPAEVKSDYTVWELRCSRCYNEATGEGVLASQLVMKGEKAPSGTVNTGNAATTKSVVATKNGTTVTAKTTTKTTTKKATTATTTKKATTTATAAKAPAATSVVVAQPEGTKLVEGLNLIDGKAVVVAKDGKATLVYAEEGYDVLLGETVLTINEAVAYNADDLFTTAAVSAAK